MATTLYTEEYARRASWVYNSRIYSSFHDKIIERLSPSKKDIILEVGCNFGELVKQLRPLCHKVIGIDINKEAIESSNCAGLYFMNATELKFKDEYFSKIISLHTIEHIPNLKKAFTEMERVLKPRGIAVLVYPFELFRGMTCFTSAIVIHKNILAARKMHLRKLNRKKINELIKGTGLRIMHHKVYFTPWPMYVTVLVKS